MLDSSRSLEAKRTFCVVKVGEWEGSTFLPQHPELIMLKFLFCSGSNELSVKDFFFMKQTFFHLLHWQSMKDREREREREGERERERESSIVKVNLARICFGQCRYKIRKHVLYRLIFIYVVCKSNIILTWRCKGQNRNFTKKNWTRTLSP